MYITCLAASRCRLFDFIQTALFIFQAMCAALLVKAAAKNLTECYTPARIKINTQKDR